MSTLSIDLAELLDTEVANISFEFRVTANNQVVAEQKVELTNLAGARESVLENMIQTATANFRARYGDGTNKDDKQ